MFTEPTGTETKVHQHLLFIALSFKILLEKT